MNMIGDMGKFTQYQVANSIPLAAQNEGGMAGLGVGVGAGVGFGQVMGRCHGASHAARGGCDCPGCGAGGRGGVRRRRRGDPGKAPRVDGKGILSKDEFEAKKAELLKKLV